VLPRKQGGAAVLVALLDERRVDHNTSMPPGSYLRQLAAENRINFYCNLDQRPPDSASDLESVISQFEDDSLILETAPSLNSPSRAWGINE
jgi:hypothetical protein